MSAESDESSTAAGSVVQFIDKERSASTSLKNMNEVQSQYRIEQYALEVLDFSSQYGSEYSISYTAPNIIGKPMKFPEYGDFPETFAMRTYGNWWDTAPSHVQEIQPQNLPKIPVQDFIVIVFEDYIIPDEIVIFETFNPGAVVRIWAYAINKTWHCIWEDEDFDKPSRHVPQTARRFSPPLRKLHLPTRTIRLEFNHTQLNYFTQIDAVLLCGTYFNVRNNQHLYEYYQRQNACSIIKKLQNIDFHPYSKGNNQNQLKDLITNDLSKFSAVLSVLNDRSSDEVHKTSLNVGLKDMPYEIMLNIFSYLDLVSLFHVGQVSRFFYDVSTHPSLYTELNLKPYWHLASTELLCTLAKRATILKKFDLSWCGLYNSISPTEFKKFIQQRGDSLTHLRLNSTKFLNASCIETLGIVCDNLREFSLRNCSIDPPLLNFSCLANLKNLERLDLFQTVIESDLLLTMLESNRKLKHLNLAFCGVAVNMDVVAQQIGQYNRHLLSLDMWKSHFLSAVGVHALSNCHDLEEVDLGWCLREASLGDSLKHFLLNCPKLKKLFLAIVRGITDRDVENIGNLCPNLEQLDLMGVLGISKERYYEILLKCKNLQLLDLSFCDNIDDSEIARWARSFNVNIKCSHAPNVPLSLRY